MKTIRLFIITVFVTILSGCSVFSKLKHTEDLSSKEEYEVILMGGQSNMVGQGKQSDLEKMTFANITFFDFSLDANLTKSKDHFGPEIGLSKELSKNYPNKKFILIKYAIGGASLLDWSPNYNKGKAEITGHPEFGNMYDKLLTLTDSLTNGYNVKIKALLWMQGERDARIPEAGENYYQNFELLISSIRKDLGNQNLPVIFGKVNPPEDGYPALDAVVNAQIRISKVIPNTYIIDTDDLEKWKDNLHYSSNGQLDLGIKFGKKITEILKN